MNITYTLAIIRQFPLVAILLLVNVCACCGQRLFRSSADSVKYESLRREILENLKVDIRSDNDELQIKAERLVVSALPAYRRVLFSFLQDLERTDRPDTITHLGLYLLDSRELPAKVAQCINLRELEIGSCRIRKMPSWLADLKHLEVITVSKSDLKRISFRRVHSGSIKSVSLPYNAFRRVPKGLTGLDSLEELNLTGNRLTTLPRFLNQFPKLVFVNMGYNRFRREKMKENSTIKSINLSHNRMKNMPFSLAGFSGLVSLNLSYNALRKIEKDIGGKSLLAVNLYSNHLAQIPKVVIGHAGLLNLDLSHNDIVEVPTTIEGMKSLTDLSLWDNEVSQLPNELGRLPALSTIYLQDNVLATLPDSLARLSMKKLDVGYNRLTIVPAWVFDQSKLEELYINNNDISEVSEEILSLRSLRILHVFGSPVVENATFQRLVGLLRERGVDVK
jgi:Leucine-rich repeat (LRR) protein